MNHPKRNRAFKPYPAISCSYYAVVSTEEDEGALFPAYYLQISRTYGLERMFGHLEIEALLSMHMELGGHSLVSHLAKRVRNGERFAPGQRVTVPDPRWALETYTVEFRPMEDRRGPYLRAVVLGMEEAYQALPTPEAEAHLATRGPLYDPYEGL